MVRARLIIVVLLASTPLLLGGAETSALSDSAPDSKRLLPDLAQDVPQQISVQQVQGTNGPEFRLGFRSAVRNVGDGPLIIRGARDDPDAAMQADQVVKLADGGSQRYRDVIPMRYAYSETHNHFHVMRFDTYSLRDAATGARVRPDSKTGFCLGDRQEVRRPRDHPPAFYGPATGECGRSQPQATKVLEGLTPGWLDDYGPQLEGQYIDITSVPAGRYSLVHRVNADRRIRERNLRNDVASALIEIEWPAGPGQPPVVRVLGSCRKQVICAPPQRLKRSTRVPVLTPSETRRFRLWCSLLDPAGRLSPAAARARRDRIAESQRVWQAARRRAAPPRD